MAKATSKTTPVKKTTAATKAPAKAASPARAVRTAKPGIKVEPVDAITLLKADHREVDALFSEFEHATRSDQKARIVARICDELKIHTLIEEEIFYPAVRAKIDPSIVDEGIVEHDGAKVLINDLAGAKASDDYYDAKVKVLAEEIRHHVHEEEKWLRGMFAQARRADLDMMKLGTKLAVRKAELKTLANGKGLPAARPVAVKLVPVD
ncbi:MAG: hemerythrin cation binding domain protein [Sphingomonas bacterium]|nr:hemerythrin cation binding domain protein [Sphingomonas bacterium]